ncbi:DNA-binding domain protein [Vibrio phage 1.017.O._10N.286.55.C11]|jgi:DNA-binding transcriptional regulator YdaS (Cro superfamily)|nr:DNA-binding domain protein [Vibrio phage 1.017.O._10N.286.55.C11]AUR85503.1 DNA-binding domain protein [Vibrio phage 1.075.O._10N.286.55.B10]AUR87049.1 DNA-binding domain protein [Vibrio phage 1.093.O._10N.286.55.E10]AUR87122.1 DNA-binding domain protein [Vibrio phage 1.094.O._10N.286.55.E12]
MTTQTKAAMDKLLSEYNHNRSELARELEVSPAAVQAWYEKGSIPARTALKIEHITNGRYKAVELCNDFR